MGKISFNGEFISAETGEEKSLVGYTAAQIRALINRMRDGDALVINAHEEVDAYGLSVRQEAGQ